ncbi:hypothetical protein ACOSP7_027971 [Xanthoceras sorbifolium]
MFNFRSIVELCDFFDLGFSGPLFTWNNKRGGSRNVQERLDQCYSVICTAWGGFDSETSGRGLRDKLVLCADRLENWSKVKFGSLKKAIDRKRSEINLLYDRMQSEQVLNAIKDSILAIPLSLGDCADSLIWHFDKTGEYSVKSGYRVAAREKLSLSGSSSSSDSKWWLALWNLNIPPKIKIFIWRVCHNVIPSLCNLCSRKIVVDPCCSRCGDAPESSAHALFWAKRAEFEEFCMILWGVWSERNAVFGSPSQPPRLPCSASWSHPPAGSLKLNTDAAVKPGMSVMGSGAVVRDSQGKGLLLAKELSLIIEWVELDAANAVARIFNSY